jgi:hypothetical protein
MSPPASRSWISQRSQFSSSRTWTLGETLYDVHLLSDAGGLVRSSDGIVVALDDAAFDALIVIGDTVIEPCAPPSRAPAQGTRREVARAATPLLRAGGSDFPGQGGHFPAHGRLQLRRRLALRRTFRSKAARDSTRETKPAVAFP